MDGAGAVSVAALLLFAGVFAVACASPGPTLTALVARVLGQGTAGALPLCLGLVLGDLFWLTLAALGAAALAATLSAVFLVIRYVGAAYLLWLAWKLWSAPVMDEPAPAIAGRGGRLVLTGLALALGNPKTMLFYLALLPTLIDLGHAGAMDLVLLGAIVTLVYGCVLAAYVLAAAQARTVLRAPHARRLANRAGSGLMAGAAVSIAAR